MKTIIAINIDIVENANIFTQIVALANQANADIQIGVNNTVNEKHDSKSETAKVKTLKVGYHIEEHNNLFCIARGEIIDGKRKNAGWSRKEVAMINKAIKELPEIITTRVTGEKSWNAWGYQTEKQAIDMMATLPTEFKIED